MKWTNEQVTSLKKLTQNGASNKDIATQLGINIKDVYAKRSQLGITIDKVNALRGFQNLTNEQLEIISRAQKENKVIIIKGPQGPTGKSTLKKVLQEKGYRVYEEYEVIELQLNKIIENPIPNLEIK